MKQLNLFVPLTKVDAARRLVYGVVTAEVPDRSQEICDYDSTKPYYQKWSQEFLAASGGKSLGNLRAMHGDVAAGRLEAIHFDDEARRIEICAKVVDPAEWAKVESGVYTGFSQGGGYVRRWPDGNDPSLTRYTADPQEISLVDLPCLPEATFTMIKADGAVQTVKFSPAEALARVERLGGDDAALSALERLESGLGAIAAPQSVATREVLAKLQAALASVNAERDAQRSTLAALTARLEKLAARIEEYGRQPLPPPLTLGLRRASDGETQRDDIVRSLAAMSGEERAAILIKVAQSRPMPLR